MHSGQICKQNPQSGPLKAETSVRRRARGRHYFSGSMQIAGGRAAEPNNSAIWRTIPTATTMATAHLSPAEPVSTKIVPRNGNAPPKAAPVSCERRAGRPGNAAPRPGIAANHYEARAIPCPRVNRPSLLATDARDPVQEGRSQAMLPGGARSPISGLICYQRSGDSAAYSPGDWPAPTTIATLSRSRFAVAVLRVLGPSRQRTIGPPMPPGVFPRPHFKRMLTHCR